MEYRNTSIRFDVDERQMLQEIADRYARTPNGTLRLLVRAAHATLIERDQDGHQEMATENA